MRGSRHVFPVAAAPPDRPTEQPTEKPVRSLLPNQTLRVGILSHHFLEWTGATDFLRNLLRALAGVPGTEIVFICPFADAGAASGNADPRSEQERLAETYDLFASVFPGLRFVQIGEWVGAIHDLKVYHGIDVFVMSVLPLSRDVPYICYWPDCQHRHLPEFFSADEAAKKDERISALLATGRPLVTNSRSARDDFVALYGADPGLVFDLPYAPMLNPAELGAAEYPGRPVVDGPYFMVSNQMWRHKSLETALEALALLGDRPGAPHLIVTGSRSGSRPGAYEALIAEFGIERRVHLLGHIPKADQLGLMRRAVSVIQPSLFEGGPGGGSVYDAHALGVRCIVSDIPVNREIPPDPAISYFEPRNAASLARLMELALQQAYEMPSREVLAGRADASRARLADRLMEAMACAITVSRTDEGRPVGIGEMIRGGDLIARRLSPTGFHGPEHTGIWSGQESASLFVRLDSAASARGCVLTISGELPPSASPGEAFAISPLFGRVELVPSSGAESEVNAFEVSVEVPPADSSHCEIRFDTARLFGPTTTDDRALGVFVACVGIGERPLAPNADRRR